MKPTYSHGREFVRQTLPFLSRIDAPRLLEHLRVHWPNSALCELLACGDEDARKVAVVCLSLTGSHREVPKIAALLHDDDPATAAFAEHAMWAVWFRAAGPAAEMQIARAVHRIGRNRFDEAITDLRLLVDRYPDWAEAHNQLAIAHFLQGDYLAAIGDCSRVLALHPYHFGAWAGLGHSYAAIGELRQALEAYRRALRVHPRLEGIRQTMMQVRRSMKTPHGSQVGSPYKSGHFAAPMLLPAEPGEQAGGA